MSEFCEASGVISCEPLLQATRGLQRCGAACLSLIQLQHTPASGAVDPPAVLPEDPVPLDRLRRLQNKPGLLFGGLSWDPWVVLNAPAPRIYFLFQLPGDARPNEQFWAYSRLGTAVRAVDGEWGAASEVIWDSWEPDPRTTRFLAGGAVWHQNKVTAPL